MKLQKQLSRKVDGKEYAKWVVVIPPSTIDELKWADGQWLKEKIQGDSLIIKPLNKNEFEKMNKLKEKMSFEIFSNTVKSVLIKHPEGLGWSQIREKTELIQKVPNNKWVRKLENEIGLIRFRDKKGNVIWKLK